MAKSRKKKSGKKLGTGTRLGALALIIAIGALSLGLYQFILSPASEGPKIYASSNDDPVVFDGIASLEYIPQLSITYSTKAGDMVLLEYSCQIYLYPIIGTNLQLYFDNNGTSASGTIHVYADSTETNSLISTGYMRSYIPNSDAGTYNVQIYATIDDESTGSFVSFSVLTVTVYPQDAATVFPHLIIPFP
jgi:hypothetical protein